MEEPLSIDDGALDEYIIEQDDEYVIEQEEPPPPNRNKNRKKVNKSKKQSDDKSDSNEKPRKNKKKATKSNKSEDKRAIMKKKKLFVKAKASNAVVFVNNNPKNEEKYDVCYSKIDIVHEDSNGENKDPLESEDNFSSFVDEIYVNNDQENLVEEDEKMVKNYLSKECCKRQCNSKFNADELLQYRIELQSLDYNENGINQLDIVLLGLIHSLCRISNEIKHSRIVEIKNRRRIKMMFGFRGVSVCRAMFMFAHCIKIERLRRLIKHYKEHGISPRAHGNCNRIPSNAISVERIREVISFLKQYADENATVVKGRSTHQNQDIKILPPHETKTRVFNKYKQACEEQNSPYISVVSFRRMWNRFCPNLMIQRSNLSETKSPSSVAEESSEITEEIVMN